VLRRPGAPFGFAAVAALFAGQFALFTYLRPFLETVTRVDVPTLSLMLLGLGLAGLIGTWLIGVFVTKRLNLLLVGLPLSLALLAVGLTALGASPIIAAALLIGWGLIGTAAPVAWWTWLSRALPDEAEAGGGLMVAVVQLAITLGAALGGALVDARGYAAAFTASAAILSMAALLSVLAVGPRAGKAPATRLKP
jgi:predicted MFS family arabinose efflux permease